MKVYTHTENSLMKTALPRLATDVERATSDYDTSMHVIDTVYSSMEFCKKILESYQEQEVIIVLIIDPQKEVDYPGGKFNIINIRRQAPVLCDDLIDIAVRSFAKLSREMTVH